MTIGIGIAIAIFDKDRDLNFGGRANALTVKLYLQSFSVLVKMCCAPARDYLEILSLALAIFQAQERALRAKERRSNFALI